MNLAIPLERTDMSFVRVEVGQGPQKVLLPPGKVIVAIDGLERSGFEYQVFKELRNAFLEVNPPASGTEVTFVPVSSQHGDMIVQRGNHIDWYDGPTLAQALGL
jgi:sulfate adenylyltransferase subunit 1 (EFTu-like GTPase family)